MATGLARDLLNQVHERAISKPIQDCPSLQRKCDDSPAGRKDHPHAGVRTRTPMGEPESGRSDRFAVPCALPANAPGAARRSKAGNKVVAAASAIAAGCFDWMAAQREQNFLRKRAPHLEPGMRGLSCSRLPGGTGISCCGGRPWGRCGWRGAREDNRRAGPPRR
jgi:hypothetical protein